MSSQSYAVYLASGEESIQHKEHIYQFQTLCTLICKELIEEYLDNKIEQIVNNAVAKAMNNAFSSAMNGIRVDVERVVDTTITGLSKQYHEQSREVDKFLSEALCKEIKNALSNIDLELIIS